MVEIVGWFGSVMLALCAAPQAWQSWKKKNSDGLSWYFLMLWFFGEVFTLIYTFQKDDVLPLLTNYSINILLLIIIIWYRLFPKH